MCTFDFDLPNITSIDRRTVLCFTCWEKHLPRPSWKPGHKPPLHYPGCCWQAWDDESSMVCWGLALITAVIYWQLPYPLTMAITSRVIVVHRAENPTVCYQGIYGWTRLSKVTQRSIWTESSPLFYLCSILSHIFKRSESCPCPLNKLHKMCQFTLSLLFKFVFDHVGIWTPTVCLHINSSSKFG